MFRKILTGRSSHNHSTHTTNAFKTINPPLRKTISSQNFKMSAIATITKSEQDIMPALTSTEPPAQQPPSTEEAQPKTESQSTNDDYSYTSDKQFQKFLRRFGGKRKGRNDSDDFIDPNDDGGGYIDRDNYRETPMDAAPDSELTRDFLECRDRHQEHWRAWHQRKRNLDSEVTGEKCDTYIKKSLAPRSHRDRNNPHLEILPIRVISNVSEEGEVPAWEDVVSHISSTRSLCPEQCESNGVRPDIEGTMAQPEIVAAISGFRNSQEMPQFVQEAGYLPILKNSLRYLWMKGYYYQECNNFNQWHKGLNHALRRVTLTALYPVYYMDHINQQTVFG
ncbi:hypothetical protein BGW39_002656 [Mortierella sp. 14UC]|nr:hypothetical protein BGW39_002656 [Mortierella sp. 14UC]